MGAWGITERQSDDGLDLLGIIIAEHLRNMDFTVFNVSEAVKLLNDYTQNEIDKYRQKPPSKITEWYISESLMLFISPYGGDYTATSQDPSIVSIEQVSGQWVAVAKASGTATITVTDKSGGTGTLALTVTPADPVDLSDNMDIRQEMIRLINQTRRENGVGELTVNDALMNAAQDSSAQIFSHHNSEYECKAAMAYGYPHGFNSNLTWFGGMVENIAQAAVTNWINSPGHFQAMIDPSCDTLGVGVTIKDGQICCYMFAGIPNSHHPYE